MSEIDIRITRARSALIREHPFFGALIMRLIVMARDDIRTLATDGKFLFYCRAFLDKIPESELIFCIAHEALHCALSHMTRRGNRDWGLWQAATDYVVNLMLKDAGFTVPTWVKYFDEKYRGLMVEQVYQMLLTQQQQEQQEDQPEPGSLPHETGDEDGNQEDGDQEGDDDGGSDDQQQGSDPESGDDQSGGEPQDGSGTSPNPQVDSQDAPSGSSSHGEGGDAEDSPEAQGQGAKGPGTDSSSLGTPNYAPSHGDPGGCGEVLDAAPPHDQAALDEVADEWQVYARQAANVAKRQGEGKAPGFVEELVEVLNNPKIDWREVLRRFVDPSNTKDFSWANPSRRMMALGYFTPGMISDGVNHVAMLIDTSMSIDSMWLRKFGAEVQAALDEGALDKITLVFIDTKVHRTAEYTKGEIIDFTCEGRGGTMFAPAFEWLNENEPNVTAAIYFTDLECSDYGPEPSYPVLWAAYDPDPRVLKSRMEKVPFGECVELQN